MGKGNGSEERELVLPGPRPLDPAPLGALAALSSGGGLLVSEGVLGVSRCARCAMDLIPAVGEEIWLENHLLAAQLEEERTLLVFVDEAFLGRTRVPRTPRAALDLFARSDPDGEDPLAGWVALSGWLYSAAHRCGKLIAEERAAFLVRDTERGTALASDIGRRFAPFTGRRGRLALLRLGDTA